MRLTAICVGALVLVGCVSATHTVRFSGAELPNDEFFGDLRVVRARASSGSTSNAGYEYWWDTDLESANAIHFRLVLQHDRSSVPALEHVVAHFGPLGQPPAEMTAIGTNGSWGVLLLLPESGKLRNKEQYGLRLAFDSGGKHYQYELIGKIEEHVTREIGLLPNQGFSKAMQ
jgi:hypothetical protein